MPLFTATNLGQVPVGGVVAWLKNLNLGAVPLPVNWIECNGQTCSDARSVYNGYGVPDLNGVSLGTQYFLRGGVQFGAAASGNFGGADNNTHSHYFSGTTGVPSALVGATGTGCAGDQYHTHDIAANTNDQTIPILPSFYEVVWVLRIF